MDDALPRPAGENESQRSAPTGSDVPHARENTHEIPPAGHAAAPDGGIGHPGIVDFAARFSACYREIFFGVVDARLTELDRDDWADVLHDLVAEGWELFRSDAAYLANGTARRWARHAAPYRSADRKRKDRRRVAREELFVREFLAAYVHPNVLDSLVAEECRQAVNHALELLPPRPRAAAIAVWLRGLSKRQAAAELGMSRDTVTDLLDEARPRLALILSDYNPRRSGAGRSSTTTRENESQSRPLSLPGHAPITPRAEGGTNA
jgi:RNA polymerase sigma factor (sigma-70 family)